MVKLVSIGKTAKGKTTWSHIDDAPNRNSARKAILEYLRSWVDTGDWSFVCVYPRQGTAWVTRRIVHNDGRTIECTLVAPKARRAREYTWLDLNDEIEKDFE